MTTLSCGNRNTVWFLRINDSLAEFFSRVVKQRHPGGRSSHPLFCQINSSEAWWRSFAGGEEVRR
jgi:hypothetical protein